MTLATETQKPTVKQLLRFSTAGSVDDGKSTLIGRLLHDSRSLYQDQIAQLQAKTGASEAPNWALLTDGLKAEREQGITIDVAYRYFNTAARKFIIADTPGHEQYTRNMATGASTADLTIVLVDARKGVRTQSRRHAFIAALMGTPNVIVAVNKMDLVGYRADAFEAIIQSLGGFMRQLGLRHVQYVPISALHGDNVVKKSSQMPWYEGPSLLEILESVSITSARNQLAFRFPIQQVLRPNQDYRGYAGQVASGRIRTGDTVMVFPSQKVTKVVEIQLFGKLLTSAKPGMSVALKLSDDLDLGRGDMLVHPGNQPTSDRHFEAMLVWFNEKPLYPGRTYLLKQTTQTVRASIDRLIYRQNVDSLDQEEAQTLELNQIGRVAISSFRDIHFDPYVQNRATGSFILIDPVDNHTLAAGMIVGQTAVRPFEVSGHQPEAVTVKERAARVGHNPLCLWLVGSQPQVRAQLGLQLERLFFDRGLQAIRLNSARVLPGLPAKQGPLGFGALTRVISLFLDAGFVVIAWPDQLDDHLKNGAREKIPVDRFLEIRLTTEPSSDPKPSSAASLWPTLFLKPSDRNVAQTIWQYISANPLFPLHHL